MQKITCLLLFLPAVAFAQDFPNCERGKNDGPTVTHIGGYTVRIAPYLHRYGRTETAECRAEILAEQGTVLFRAEDESMHVSPVSGKDINDDGIPEIVIEGEHCGSACFSGYWILSLKRPPSVILHIKELYGGFGFVELNGNGHFGFIGQDDAFGNFGGLSAADSPYPQVVLRLVGKHFQNISEEFWNKSLRYFDSYETQLAKAKARLVNEDVRRFRSISDMGPRWSRDSSPYDGNINTTENLVLQVVLTYLYSGRGKESFDALRQLWPPNDVTHAAKEILKAYCEGVLRLSDSCHKDAKPFETALDLYFKTSAQDSYAVESISGDFL